MAKKSVEQWKVELRERGLFRTVRQACRKHRITFAEFFNHSRTRAVAQCRREVFRALHNEQRTPSEIGRWFGIDPALVSYHLNQDKKARQAAV